MKIDVTPTPKPPTDIYGYSYDARGNRESETHNGTTRSFDYNLANQIEGYTYDANGNLTNAGTTTYAWDGANRLTSVTAGTSTHSYSYDPFGNRISQTVGGATTQYLVDPLAGLPQVLSEYGPNNATTHYLPGIGQYNGTSWSYFGTDGLGSTRFMLNSARNVTYAANYDPYGQVMAQYLPNATPSFGFTGQMTDASGLQYLRARYYDPSTGTFLSQDPKIGAYPQLSASWNGYSYAHGNPTTFIDPSGEIPLLFAAAVFVGGTIIGGVSYGAWDVSVEQGIGLGGHNQFNFGAINWGQAGGAFRTGANTGMAVSSFFTGLRTSYTAARMGAGAGRYLASHTALDFGLGVAGDMVINGDSIGEAVLWNTAGFVGGEVVGAGVALADRGVRAGVGAGVGFVRRGMRTRSLNPFSHQSIVNGRVRTAARRGSADGGRSLAMRRAWFADDANTTFYHGTSSSYARRIRESGIDLRYSRPNADFGSGFYLSTSKNTAEWSARRLYGDDIDVVEFVVSNEHLKGLSSLNFTSPNTAWADFVKFHKIFAPSNLMHGGSSYDMVTGPLVQRIRSTGAVVPWENGIQTSIHTLRAVDIFNLSMKR